MPLRTIIVDDEAPARDELRYLLETLDHVTVCGEASCGEEGVKLARAVKPDMVFLDIMMDDRDGLSVARQILAGHRQTMIVFATAFNQYAIDAFEINAVDYVLKPFSRERVASSVERARQILRERTSAQSSWPGLPDSGRTCRKEKPRQLNRIPAYAGHRLHLVEPDDILYCCVEAGEVLIVSGTDRFKAGLSLHELETRLAGEYFYRTHRAFLVNLQKVRQIIPWFKGSYKLVLQGGPEVPVSRVFVHGLKEILNIRDCRFGARNT